MKRIEAHHHGLDTEELASDGDGGLDSRNLVTFATHEHEAHVAREHTWPALPAHLRSLPDYRAMVRHWVRTRYEWKP